jgi:F-type H+-transporting ATPase subunit c
MDALAGSYLGAGLCMGIAALGGCIGIGILMAKAFDSMARQPEILNTMRPLIFIGIAFVEAVALYALVISILLVTKQG